MMPDQSIWNNHNDTSWHNNTTLHTVISEPKTTLWKLSTVSKQPQQQQFYSSCPRLPRWAGTKRNIHQLTPILVINHRYQLPPSTMIHSIFPVQFMCLTVLLHHLFFGLSLGLEPSTSYSIHFFTQSLSSFRNTHPYHHNLFCCSTEIMSSLPVSLS